MPQIPLPRQLVRPRPRRCRPTGRRPATASEPATLTGADVAVRSGADARGANAAAGSMVVASTVAASTRGLRGSGLDWGWRGSMCRVRQRGRGRVSGSAGRGGKYSTMAKAKTKMEEFSAKFTRPWKELLAEEITKVASEQAASAGVVSTPSEFENLHLDEDSDAASLGTQSDVSDAEPDITDQAEC